MENVLKQLGLNEKEILVYKSLLERGASTASSLANVIDLPRQTVYSILQKLCDEGIIEKGPWKGAHKFIADPTNLSSIVRSRQKKLTRIGNTIEELMPELLAMRKLGANRKPSVQYYDGVFGLKRLFDEIIEQYKRKEDAVFRGFGINYFENTDIQEILDDFVRERYKYGIKTHLLIGKGGNDFGITKDGSTALGREVRSINMEAQNAGIYLVGDRIYLFSYEDDVGIMIEQKLITQLLKNIFDLEWDRAKELDKEIRRLEK
jgi:sugar-specific transcriptional regulator TrmB